MAPRGMNIDSSNVRMYIDGKEIGRVQSINASNLCMEIEQPMGDTRIKPVVIDYQKPISGTISNEWNWEAFEKWLNMPPKPRDNEYYTQKLERW